MSMTDPIADMLTRIRNAIMAGHTSADIPSSKIKVEIARILTEEGFLSSYKSVDDRKQGVLRVSFKFSPEGEAVISGLQKVSKPGRRIYCKKGEIPPVLGGLGVNILSTSRGLVSGQVARTQGIGGEILVNVW